MRGPSVTPRPPQGQPVIAALAHAELPYRFAAASADVVFVTPQRIADAAGNPRARCARRRPPWDARASRCRCSPTSSSFLDGDESAADRLDRLDGLGRLLVSDTRIFAGSAAALADEIAALGDAGYAGVRLRPGVVTDDLAAHRGRPRSRAAPPGPARLERRRVAARRAGPSDHRPQPLRRRRWPAETTQGAEHEHDTSQADHPRRVRRRGQRAHAVGAPRRGQPDRVRHVPPRRADRRARPVRLLLPRRGPRAARARREGVRPRHRGSARHPPGARRARRGDRAHRPRRHAERDLQRAVRAGPSAVRASTTSPAAAPAGTS